MLFPNIILSGSSDFGAKKIIFSSGTNLYRISGISGKIEPMQTFRLYLKTEILKTKLKAF